MAGSHVSVIRRRRARLTLLSLEMFSFFMLTGVFSTLLLPETMGRSLEEISNENQDGFLSYAASTAARTS